MTTFAGYSVTRFDFKGKKVIVRGLLLSYMFPPILLAIPLYVFIAQMRLEDSLSGLIVTYTAQSIPFSTWLLWSFFRGIPTELEDAAMTDGATRIGALFKVIFPLAIPGIVATAVFAFMWAWSEFMFAFIFLSSPSNNTIPLGIRYFQAGTYHQWHFMMSLSTLALIPVVLLFAIIQKYLIKGLAAGAVKM